jgi:hypothetical protein
MITEQQNTTIKDGDRISGELVIRFEDISLDGFLRYRGRIRDIVGFGKIGISHTIINERALVVENQLDHHPETHAIAYPALDPEDPPKIKPTTPPRPKRHFDHTWIRGKSATFLMELNVPEAEVMSRYHAKFKVSKFTDEQILTTWRKYRERKGA